MVFVIYIKGHGVLLTHLPNRRDLLLFAIFVFLSFHREFVVKPHRRVHDFVLTILLLMVVACTRALLVIRFGLCELTMVLGGVFDGVGILLVQVIVVIRDLAGAFSEERVWKQGPVAFAKEDLP